MEILGGRDMLPLGLLASGEQAEIMEIRERKGYQSCNVVKTNTEMSSAGSKTWVSVKERA